MDFIKEAREKMDKAVEATKHRFTGIRAGRASIVTGKQIGRAHV